MQSRLWPYQECATLYSRSIAAYEEDTDAKVAMGWAGKRHGDWTTLCHSCLKYAQYLRLCSPGRLSRCRFHNRPYNLHLGVHVTRRKKCALFFLSVALTRGDGGNTSILMRMCSKSAIRGHHTAEERLP